MASSFSSASMDSPSETYKIKETRKPGYDGMIFYGRPSDA